MRWLLILLAGCPYEPPADAVVADGPASDAAPTRFTLFVADFMASRVHRYAIADTGDVPTVNQTIQLSGALSPVIAPTDELFVGEVSNPILVRFTTPLAAPMSAGTITANGLGANMGKMIVVDDQLYVVNPASSNVMRFGFDEAGNAAVVGEITGITNGRGIVFDPAKRNLYVTECCATNALLQFGIDATGKAQMKSMTSGAALSNPHGMVLTPWGELLVANAGGSEIRRFTLDASGRPAPTGTISGNGLDTPVDLVMTPWQELYVTNQGGGRISRFTFDEAHVAIAKDNFAVPAAQAVTWAFLDVR